MATASKQGIYEMRAMVKQTTEDIKPKTSKKISILEVEEEVEEIEKGKIYSALKFERLRAKVSIQELSRHLNIRQEWLKGYEEGSMNPSDQTYDKIKKYFQRINGVYVRETPQEISKRKARARKINKEIKATRSSAFEISERAGVLFTDVVRILAGVNMPERAISKVEEYLRIKKENIRATEKKRKKGPISQWLRLTNNARYSIRVTAQKMAEDLNISQSYFSKIENGQRDIPANFLDAVDQYFKRHGLTITKQLNKAACLQNGSVNIEDMSEDKKELILLIAFEEVGKVSVSNSNNHDNLLIELKGRIKKEGQA